MKKKELTLVNLVHTSEGDLGELLQRHHVDGCRHGLLAARLGTLAQLTELCIRPVYQLALYISPLL